MNTKALAALGLGAAVAAGLAVWMYGRGSTGAAKAARDLEGRNPNLDVVETYSAANLIAVKDKKTGLAAVVPLSAAADAKMRVEACTGEALQTLPDWCPLYPGAGQVTCVKWTGATAFSFETRDAPEAIDRFYGDRFGKKGFAVNRKSQKDSATVSARGDEDAPRALVMAAAGSGLAHVYLRVWEDKPAAAPVMRRPGQ